MGGEGHRWGKSDGAHGGETIMKGQRGEGMGEERRGERAFFLFFNIVMSHFEQLLFISLHLNCFSAHICLFS